MHHVIRQTDIVHAHATETLESERCIAQPALQLAASCVSTRTHARDFRLFYLLSSLASTHTSIYIFIYLCVCVLACVCARRTKRALFGARVARFACATHVTLAQFAFSCAPPNKTGGRLRQPLESSLSSLMKPFARPCARPRAAATIDW